MLAIGDGGGGRREGEPKTQAELFCNLLVEAGTNLPSFKRGNKSMRSDQVLEEPEILLQPILENTLYHTLLDSSFIHLSHSCRSLAVGQARGQNHATSLCFPKEVSLLATQMGRRRTALLQRHQKVSEADASLMSVTQRDKERAFISAGRILIRT